MQYQFASLTFPRTVAKLPYGNPATRLASFRLVGKYPCVVGPYQADPGTNPGQTFSFYLESDFQPFTRWAWCDEVEGVRIDHDGWFSDNYLSQTIRGLVVNLGKGRGFLAGWSMGEGMASSVDRCTVFQSIENAAYHADTLAEYAAEAQQDYERAENARLEAEEEAETLASVSVDGDGI